MSIRTYFRRPELCSNESGVQRYLSNTLWLFGGHVLRMVVTLGTAALLARYLGPSRYGVYNYVLSIISLIQIFGNLGLMKILNKELIEQPEEHREILGTAFVLNVMSGSLIFVLLLAVLSVVSISLEERQLGMVFGGLLIVDSFRCLGAWFHAQVKGPYTVVATTLPMLVAAAFKLAAIWVGADLVVFAQLYLLEIFGVGVTYAWLYQRRDGRLSAWTAHWETAVRLLHQSWPLLLAGFATTFYFRIDQVMLGVLIGNAAVGEYAVATRLSSIWQFVPLMLTYSLSPVLLRVRREDSETYRRRLQGFFDLNMALAYAITLPLFFLAPVLVPFLFGSDFREAERILAIHIWSCPFMFLGIARNVHLLRQGCFRFSLLASSAGAVLNLGLNFFLIPRYGGVGAAVATLVSQGITAIVLNWFHPQMRELPIMQLRSLLLPFRLSALMRSDLLSHLKADSR